MKKEGRESYSFGIKIIIFCVFFSAVVFPSRVFCYDTKVAHPNIAELATKLYNQKFDRDLTNQEIDWIKQGSEEEDTPTRWLNHFYDPIYNRGIWFGKQQLSAKDWANNSKEQRNFSLGDKSWQRGLIDLKNENREDAFRALGHVIHLVSDMAVPAHTRDDIHVIGDSYEQFVKNNWDSIEGNLSYQFQEVENLSMAFDSLANFSNNYFYSDDTIQDKKYKIVNVVKNNFLLVDGSYYKFYFAKVTNGLEYKLFYDKNVFSWQEILNGKFSNENFKVNHDFVLSDYSKNLIPQAISYSSGVIKLFLDQAGSVDLVDLPKSRTSLLGYADRAVGSIIQGAEDVFALFKSNTPSVAIVKSESAPTISAPTNFVPAVVESEPATEEVDSTVEDYSSGFTYSYSPPKKQVVTPTAEPVIEVKKEELKSPIVIEQTNNTVKEEVKINPLVYNFGGGGGGGSTLAPEQSSSIVTAQESDATTITDEAVTVTSSTEQTEDIASTSTPTVIPTTTPEATTSTEDNSTTSTSMVTSTPTSTPEISAVVFNEIGWMGTNSLKSADEWLELYNNTDEDIDITGWKIFVSDKEINWQKKQGIILAHGYYLLERSDENTVKDITADGIFTVTGGLNNNGEKLIIQDSDENIVDEVDCSAGWFAGSTDNGKYKSMEKVDSTLSGNEANNWQSANSVSYLGRADGGTYIIGSPRIANQKYWLLKELTNYYSDQFSVSNTLKLTEAESPYLIDAMIEIPAGYTVEIEPGVVLANAFDGAYFLVEGNLVINGTAEEPVVFTSILDFNYISFNPTVLTGTASSGDWGRIEVKEGGRLNANHTKFYYGGSRFMAPTGWFYNKFMMQTIRNIGGEVQIDHCEFKFNPVDPIVLDRVYNAIIWTEAPLNKLATTTISNSLFDGGWMAVGNYQGLIKSFFDNNIFQNFQNPDGPIVSQYNFSELNNNTIINNVNDWVDLGMLSLNQDINLVEGVNYLFSTILVPVSTTLTLDAGAVVTMRKQGDIQVQGKLIANGTNENPITIKSRTGEQWGIIALQNSVDSNLKYTNITSGNNSLLYTPTTRGMITMISSTLEMDNVSLVEARRPWYMVYAKNSQLSVKNSLISWSSVCTTCSGAITVGIESSGSSTINLDNTYFNRMTRGIEINTGGTLTLSNMDATFFQNITDLNW